MRNRLQLLLVILFVTSIMFAQGMGVYEIYQDGRLIGTSNFELVKVGNNYQLRTNTNIEKGGTKVQYIEEALLNEKMNPLSYNFVQKEPNNLMTVTAEFSKDMVEITKNAGNEEKTEKIEVKDAFFVNEFLPIGMYIISSTMDFEKSESAEFAALDPENFLTGKITLSNDGDEKIDGQRYFKIKGKAIDNKFEMAVRKQDGVPVRIEFDKNNIEARLSNDNSVAAKKTAPNVTSDVIVKTPEIKADNVTKINYTPAKSASGYKPLSAAMVSDPDFMKNVKSIKDFDALIGLNISGFADIVYLNRLTQEFGGTMDDAGNVAGEINIKKKHHRVTGSPDLPLEYPLEIDEKYLLPEAGIDCDDEQIIARAEKSVKPARNLWDAARAINRWVYLNIDYTDQSAGAKETFVNLKGDSRAKALLTVALMRAAGIPSRVIGGMLYADGQMVDHFWVEAFMGKSIGWGPLDPTTNEADEIAAGHMSLYVGSQSIPVTASDVSIENIKADD